MPVDKPFLKDSREFEQLFVCNSALHMGICLRQAGVGLWPGWGSHKFHTICFTQWAYLPFHLLLNFLLLHHTIFYMLPVLWCHRIYYQQMAWIGSAFQDHLFGVEFCIHFMMVNCFSGTAPRYEVHGETSCLIWECICLIVDLWRCTSSWHLGASPCGTDGTAAACQM